MPHSEVPAAVPAKGAVSTDQAAISTVCRTRVAVAITSAAKSSTSAAGTQGAPSLAVISDGNRSLGLHAPAA